MIQPKVKMTCLLMKFWLLYAAITLKSASVRLKVEFDFVVRVIDVDIPDGIKTPFSKANWLRFYTHNSYYIQRTAEEERRRHLLLYFGLYRLLNSKCVPNDLEYFYHEQHHKSDSKTTVQHLDSFHRVIGLTKDLVLNITTNELIIHEKHQTLFDSEFFLTKKTNREVIKTFEQVCQDLTRARLGTVKICRFFINSPAKNVKFESPRFVVHSKQDRANKNETLLDAKLQNYSSQIGLKINSALRRMIRRLKAVKSLNQLKDMIGENSIQNIFQSVFDFFTVGHFLISSEFIRNQIDKYYQNYLYKIAIVNKQQVKSFIFIVLAVLFGGFLVIDFCRVRKRDTIRDLKSDVSRFHRTMRTSFLEGNRRLIDKTVNEIQEASVWVKKVALLFQRPTKPRTSI